MDDDSPRTLLVGRYTPGKKPDGDANEKKRRKIAAFDFVSWPWLTRVKILVTMFDFDIQVTDSSTGFYSRSHRVWKEVCL